VKPVVPGIDRIGCPTGKITAIYKLTFGLITARAALKIGSNLPWAAKQRQLVFPRHPPCVIAARESNTQIHSIDASAGDLIIEL
jgi:hypothetical protein